MTHEPSPRSSESGQTMAEYAVVLALIMIATVTTFIAVGDGVLGFLTTLTDRL